MKALVCSEARVSRFGRCFAEARRQSKAMRPNRLPGSPCGWSCRCWPKYRRADRARDRLGGDGDDGLVRKCVARKIGGGSTRTALPIAACEGAATSTIWPLPETGASAAASLPMSAAIGFCPLGEAVTLIALLRIPGGDTPGEAAALVKNTASSEAPIFSRRTVSMTVSALPPVIISCVSTMRLATLYGESVAAVEV